MEKKQTHHVVPLKIYANVWISLLVLTVLTVAVSYVDFGGNLNLLIAMFVATVKALLVLLFFMGLKYEGAENPVTIGSSLIFLLIFLSLSGADVFYRLDETPAEVEKAAASSESVDVKKIIHATPELVGKGKQLYAQNCVTCHGETGHGDGAAAAALNPKPRNFTQDAGWKSGRKVTQLFVTLTKGLPGTPMPGFAGLAVEDRFALAHYVQSLGPQAAADTDSDVAALGLSSGASAKPALTIPEAMDKLAEPSHEEAPVAYNYVKGVSPRRIYCKLPAAFRPRWCDVNTSEIAP